VTHIGVGLQVRSVIDRLVRDGTAVARADGSSHELFPIAVPPEVGEALGAWVRRENAKRTIEIGLGYGISALYICEGLVASGHPDARHVAIDPYQTSGPDGRGFASCGLQFLEDAGLKSIIEHHEEESQIALPRLLADGRTFDLAFVDGNHRFDRVFLDLYYLGRLVRRGGIVILDDYQLPAIVRAASFFLTNLGWELEEVSDSDGLHHWAVLRTSRVKDARPLAYFIDF
jgi:predicted O-methyltransferase YrrM